MLPLQAVEHAVYAIGACRPRGWIHSATLASAWVRHSASACWRAERSALLQLDDHLQQRLIQKKMPSWEDLMNCVCMNGGGAQRPGVQEVIDTLQRSSVCTGTQCFETEAE